MRPEHRVVIVVLVLWLVVTLFVMANIEAKFKSGLFYTLMAIVSLIVYFGVKNFR